MLPKYKDIIELMKKGSTIEAQEQIMTLREGALELQEENQELRSKIREIETQLKASVDWGEEKQRYILVNPWHGPAQVYALKKDNSESEVAHYLCTNCFSNEKKVILTPSKRNGDAIMVCPSCKSSLDTGYSSVGPAQYAEDHE